MPRNILNRGFLKLIAGRMLRVGVLSAILSGLILQVPSNALVDAGGGGVPVRSSIEDRGGTVVYDATKKKVTTTLNGKTVEMWIGNPVAKVNGVSTWIDETNHSVAPKITNSKTVLPAGFIEKTYSSDKPGSTPKATVPAQSSLKIVKANPSPTIPKATVSAQSSSNMTDVAIKAIVEASGGTAVWDAKTGKITTIVNGKTIVMWIGNPKALVNGVPTWIDETNHSVAPKITDSKTVVPVGFIEENYKPAGASAKVATRAGVLSLSKPGAAIPKATVPATVKDSAIDRPLTASGSSKKMASSTVKVSVGDTKDSTHPYGVPLYSDSSLVDGINGAKLPLTITTGCRSVDIEKCNPVYCKSNEGSCSIASSGSLGHIPCHFNGTCADVTVPGGGYAKAIAALNCAGLDVLDETGDGCGKSTGSHLHVALPSATGSGTRKNASTAARTEDSECWHLAGTDSSKCEQ